MSLVATSKHRSQLFLRCAAAVAWLGWLILCARESSEPAVFGHWSAEYAGVLAAIAAAALLLTALCFEGPRSWFYRNRFPIIALGLMSAVSLTLLEVGIRVVDPIGISYYEESKRYQLMKRPHPELIYAHPRNWKGKLQGVDVSFNEFGFRDAPVRAREDDELRILLLGDSVTFGWGVAQEEIFAHQMELILEGQLGRPVEVINTGVGSYNTVQEEAVVNFFGESLEPDLIVLLYVYNDLEVRVRPYDPYSQYDTSKLNAFGRARLLLRESWLYRLTSHVQSVLARDPEAEASDEAEDEKPPGLAASLDALRGIDTWADTKSIPFVTFVCRPDAWEDDWLIDMLRAVGAERDFPVVEAIPAWFKVRDYRLTAVDSHPNAAGHRILAEGISRTLREQGLATPAD